MSGSGTNPQDENVNSAQELLPHAWSAVELTWAIRERLSGDMEQWNLSADADLLTLDVCGSLETALHLALQAEICLHRVAALLTTLSAEEKALHTFRQHGAAATCAYNGA